MQKLRFITFLPLQKRAYYLTAKKLLKINLYNNELYENVTDKMFKKDIDSCKYYFNNL